MLEGNSCPTSGTKESSEEEEVHPKRLWSDALDCEDNWYEKSIAERFGESAKRRLIALKSLWPYKLTCCQTIHPQSACPIFPWLLTTVDDGRTGCQFINCWGTEIFFIDFSIEIGSSCCLYSRGGWLLLSPLLPVLPCFSTLVLVNPLRGNRIELPGCIQPRLGAFSVTDMGSPDCVVVVWDDFDALTLWIWRPGYSEWTLHKCAWRLSDGLAGMVFCGRRVHCFYGLDGMCVFDMSGACGSWSIVRKLHRNFADRLGQKFFMLGPDGQEILKVNMDSRSSSSYRFYKLDQAKLEWVKLEDEHLEDIYWFLNARYSLSTKVVGGGRKVYRPKIADGDSGMPKTQKQQLIEIHDLVDGGTRTFLSSVASGKYKYAWIDLGM